MIDHEQLSEKLIDMKSADIIVHPIGHGVWDDFHMLVVDLQAEGFTVKIHGDIENKSCWRLMQFLNIAAKAAPTAGRDDFFVGVYKYL